MKGNLHTSSIICMIHPGHYPLHDPSPSLCNISYTQSVSVHISHSLRTHIHTHCLQEPVHLHSYLQNLGGCGVLEHELATLWLTALVLLLLLQFICLTTNKHTIEGNGAVSALPRH